MHESPRIRVACLLHREGRLLLVRHEKAGRAYWLLPGGGVEAGETLRDALARELSEEIGLAASALYGPVALAETIAPPGAGQRRHILHVIFAADLPQRAERLAAGDSAIRDLRLFRQDEVGGLDLRPPIHRFLERWRLGDPFVYLGAVWSQ